MESFEVFLENGRKMVARRRGLKPKLIVGSVATVLLTTVTTTVILLYLSKQHPEDISTYLLIAALFYVVFGLAVVLFISKIMVQPVIELTEKVDQIRNGNFEVSIENKSSGDEMGKLFDGFNSMVKDLRSSITALREEKEKAEHYSKELYDSKSKLETIFNGISDGIMVIDRDFHIIAANPFFEKIMQHPEVELRGNHCYEMCHDGGYLCRACNAMATFETGKYLSNVRTIVDKSGSKRYMEVHNFPLRNEQGNVEQIIEYVKEVTGVIRAQEKMEQSKRLAELGVLAAKVAHEVRNPLNAIEGAAHYLLSEFKTTSAVQTFGTLIRDQVARLSRVTTDLLNYAKPMKAELIQSSVVTVINHSLETLKPQLDAKGINTTLSLSENLPDVLIDPSQMEQAIVNVIANSIDAMNEGGNLTIGLKPLSEPSNGIETGIQIVIVDDGCGIKDGIKSDIFSLFFTTKEKGTGLGLPIVSRVIANHQGSMEIQSVEGCGTTVVMNLPSKQELELEIVK